MILGRSHSLPEAIQAVTLEYIFIYMEAVCRPISYNFYNQKDKYFLISISAVKLVSVTLPPQRTKSVTQSVTGFLSRSVTYVLNPALKQEETWCWGRGQSS